MPSSPARRLRSSTAANKKTVLVIQTNVLGRLYVWLVDGQGRIEARAAKKIVWHGSEFMLALIDSLLRRAKIQPADIGSIFVVRGPGPFTAVRTGLVIANTLGMILDVPVQGIVSAAILQSRDIKQALSLLRPATKKSSVVRPWYGREPNITLPRRAG